MRENGHAAASGLSPAQRAVVAKLDRGVDRGSDMRGLGTHARPSREEVRPVWQSERQRRGRSTDDAAFERWWRAEEPHP